MAQVQEPVYEQPKAQPLGQVYHSIPSSTTALQWDGKNLEDLKNFIEGLDLYEGSRARWNTYKDLLVCSPIGVIRFGSWHICPGYWVTLTSERRINIMTDADFRARYVVE